MDFSAVDLARQLCLIDYNLLAYTFI